MNGIKYIIDMIDTITGAMDMHHDHETERREEQALVDAELAYKEAYDTAVLYAKTDLNNADVGVSMENLSNETHRGLTESAKSFFSATPGSHEAKRLETVIGRLVLGQILEDLIDGQ